METTERLYRSKANKVIGGVAGGLANYFNIDVVLARVAFVLLAMFGGGGVLIYIIMWIAIPAQTTYYKDHNGKDHDSSVENDVYEQNENNELIKKKSVKNSNRGLITGIILIFMGIIFLADQLMPWYNITELWPLLLVIVGVLMIKPDIFKPSKKQNNEI
jgi:phage shock protein PspC (stress-responsive transcriptional regulator)